MKNTDKNDLILHDKPLHDSFLLPLIRYMNGEELPMNVVLDISNAHSTMVDQFEDRCRQQCGFADSQHQQAMMIFTALRSPEKKALHSFAVQYLKAAAEDLENYDA